MSSRMVTIVTSNNTSRLWRGKGGLCCEKKWCLGGGGGGGGRAGGGGRQATVVPERAAELRAGLWVLSAKNLPGGGECGRGRV